jgi:hypothetical protein
MKILITWAAIFFGINLLPYLLLPKELIEPHFLIIANLILFFTLISLRKIYRWNNKGLLPGMFFILMFFLFFYLGTLNLYLVKSIFPVYGGETLNTFVFWLFYFLTFLLGYFIGYRIFFKKHRSIKQSKTFWFIPNGVIHVLFVIATFFTFISVSIIGFIPILHPELGTQRFFADIGILIRFWMLLMPIGIFYFIRYQYNKNLTYIFLLFLCLVQMTFFYVRFNIFLTGFSIVIVYLLTNKISGKLIGKLILIFIVALVFNSLFLDRREGSETLLAKRSNLGYFQTNILYYTFNEFRQLNDLINLEPPVLYGKTFLSIPISFIPYQITDALAISKEEIKEENSALILMELSKADSGLRSGLAGELYINFRYYGLIISVFVGLLIAKLDQILKKRNIMDSRIVTAILLQVTIFYGVFVGQIDAVGSYLFSIFLFYIIFRIISRRQDVTEVKD